MPKSPITNITFGTMTLGYRGYRHVKEVLYDSGLDHRFGWAGQEDNI
jgi:hypothetical protein